MFVYARLDMDIDCISIRNVMDNLRFPIGAFKVTEKLDNSQVFKIGGKNTYFLATPKENKIRTVELSEVARNIIDTILDISESEWLFPNPEDNMNWMWSYYFDRTIRKVCKELRIPQRSMHKFRKSYSSILLAQGLPEKLVQTQLGHSDILTTQRAYH